MATAGPLHRAGTAVPQTRWLSRPAWGLVAVALLCASGVGPARAERTGGAGPAIVAAVPSGFPPYYMLDAAGRPTGFAIDVMDRVAASAGLTVVYQSHEGWLEALQAVKQGAAQLVPNLGITAARRQDFDFTRPVEALPISIFVRNGTSDVDSLEGLAGRIVGAVRTNAAVSFLERRPELRLRVFDTVDEGLIHLLAGQIAALAYPERVLRKLLRDSGLEDRIKVVGPPILEIRRAIAVRKGDPALVERLDAAVGRFLESPEYAALTLKWFGKPSPYWTPARIAWAMGGLTAAVALLLLGWRFVSVGRLNRELRTRMGDLEQAISQRERFQQEMVASEARYRALVEGSIQGILVHRDGKPLFANAAFARIFGHDRPEEILALESTTGLYAPHERPRIMAYREARMRGEAAPVQYDYEGRTRDGQAVWVEAHNRRIDWNGEPAVQVTAIDITQRKRAMDELARSEALNREHARHARQLVDSMPLTLVVVDGEGRITDVNLQAESHFGYQREELLGQPVETLVPERFRDRHPGLRTGFHAAPSQRRMGSSLELFALRKDGSEFQADISLSPMETSEGLRVLSWVQDISERVALERQLNQAQRMETVGRLAGGIAHDFNNMLAVILSYANFLLDEMPEGDPRRDDVNQILAAAARSAALTKQLLAFSRRQVLKLEDLNLNAVVAGTEKMLRRLIGEDVRLQTNLAQDLGIVRADGSQVGQILMNLAVNARDAMPTGGQLTIETANVELDDQYARGHLAVKPGPHVMVSVSDTGTGMDQATQANIFEPFFTTKEPGKGTGLGLATVFGIVKQLGGNIWVYSEVEHGTTFKIYLPRIASDLAPVAAEPPQAAEARGTGTVLLIEDEELVRAAARRILEGGGYTVLEAGSGAEALDLARENAAAIDLVLTDVVMPGMSGAEAAERLTDLIPGVRILFMTGYTQGAIADRGILAEGVQVVFKPFTRTTLVQAVREALGTT